MIILNPEVIEELRKRRMSGENPSALLHYLKSQCPDNGGLGLMGMKYFREAFDFSLGQVLSIPGWASGEIPDERIDEFLLPEFNRKNL
ncbi:hypothetical protein ACO0LM_15895 [Undibacterium sp. Di26W]|uniref:hypothetical protein n=1 Tax=Undibacterium sp. Di26W TaxID=3413035 RepID=UPI003BEF6592